MNDSSQIHKLNKMTIFILKQALNKTGSINLYSDITSTLIVQFIQKRYTFATGMCVHIPLYTK